MKPATDTTMSDNQEATDTQAAMDETQASQADSQQAAANQQTDQQPDLEFDGDASVHTQADQDAVEESAMDDSLTFSNGVIEKIVAIAAREVTGVLGMKGGWLDRVQETFGAKDPGKGVSVEVTADNGVRIYLSVIIEYGAYAPQIFEDVKRAVVSQVSGMTGLHVAGVNLRIEDVLTPEEYEAKRRQRSVNNKQETNETQADETAE